MTVSVELGVLAAAATAICNQPGLGVPTRTGVGRRRGKPCRVGVVAERDRRVGLAIIPWLVVLGGLAAAGPIKLRGTVWVVVRGLMALAIVAMATETGTWNV